MMYRNHKIVKLKFRFVMASGAIIQKKIFCEYSQARAKAKFYAKLHQLPPGGTITLFQWDLKQFAWEQIAFGGKDKV